MEAISLQAGLPPILLDRPLNRLGNEGTKGIAQAFDELFASLLLKNVNLVGTEGADTDNIWNELARASLVRQIGLGQSLGLGRLFVEEHAKELINDR